MHSSTNLPKFMLDRMLTRVGKYLRIIGYDAAWEPTFTTQELIWRANAEDRIFVSCNRGIPHQRPGAKQLVLLAVSDPVRQFHELVAQFDLDTETRLFTACIRCNVSLEPVADPESIRGKVHPNVFARAHRFFTCPQCGTVFWWGSHVQNTCRKLGLALPHG